MKKPDLEKLLAGRIAGRMKQEPHSDRYGAASGHVFDKKEQRERDKAAGLVPFAVKLPQELVTILQDQARTRGVSLNDLAAELLREGLAKAASAAKPAASAVETKPPKAAKAPAKPKKS